MTPNIFDRALADEPPLRIDTEQIALRGEAALRRRRRLAVLSVAVTAAIITLGAALIPDLAGKDTATPHQAPEAGTVDLNPEQPAESTPDLRRWEDALAAAPDGAIVPVNIANRIENSVGNPANYTTPPGLYGVISFAPGAADLPAPVDAGGLPTLNPEEAVRVAWQTPPGDAVNGTSTLTRPRPEILSMLTINGPREVPVWRFDVEGSTVTVTALAIDPAYLVMPNGMPPAEMSSTSLAQQVDDRTITITVAGAADGCGKEYQAHAVAGSRAIAVVVKTIQRPRVGACTDNTVYRELTLTLDEPMGERALIGVDGHAMYVQPAAK
jgi:hypothetical protein